MTYCIARFGLELTVCIHYWGVDVFLMRFLTCHSQRLLAACSRESDNRGDV